MLRMCSPYGLRKDLRLLISHIRSTMKNKQSLKLRSAVLLSACVLGFYTVSCSSLHKDKGLPVIGKSVALFDHFNYKGEDDFYVSNPLPSEDSF